MQGLEIEGELPEKKTCYEGVFYNYFSIGMFVWFLTCLRADNYSVLVYVCVCGSLPLSFIWSRPGLYFLSFYTSLLIFWIYITGMDAQVAYGFHHLRNEKPYLAQGPISNKVWFVILLCEKSCDYGLLPMIF